jgi:hypothetical protein
MFPIDDKLVDFATKLLSFGAAVVALWSLRLKKHTFRDIATPAFKKTL